MNTANRLTVFFYLLLRDHLPAGLVEELARQAELGVDGQVSQLSNEHVAAYAEELSQRLTPVCVERGAGGF